VPREIRVLMVEDSEDDSLLVLRELEVAGYQVAHLRIDTGPQLRAALDGRKWDVVISDYNMPGFTGVSALRIVREREPDLPLIFVSGTMGEEIAVDAMKFGANDYVMKGQLKRLVPAIERELRDAAIRREQRRMAGELRESEQRFSKVFHTASIGIAVTTLLEGRFVEVNEAFVRIVGSESDLLGRTLREVGLWSDPVDYVRVVDLLAGEGRVRDLDLVIRQMNGTTCPVLASVEHIEVGGESCLLFLLHDVSDRVRLETQLQQSQKMEAVGRLAGGVAHDFNNMLTVMMGYCAALNEALATHETLREDVVQIQRAAERAAALTKQLLAFSRQQVMEVQSVNLNVIVTRLEPMLRRLIPEHIALTTSLASDLGTIRSDPGQLEQILMNLIVNSRDAMSSGGELTIETAAIDLDSAYVDEHVTARAGSYVRLTVSDTGVGMDEQTKARIFEPFFTTKPPGQGTGLGLSTVYGAVKQNEGFVWVYSEPGLGTTFKIYLPRVDVALEERSEERVPTSLRGSERILVVEDDAVLRKLANDMLARQGYQVLTASDGVAAMELMSTADEPIDLLITDIVMPRMGGRELAERLMQERPGMQVLFTSGYTDDMVGRQDLVNSGAAFLQKPYTPTVLWTKVRGLLDAGALRDSEAARRVPRGPGLEDGEEMRRAS
jgi:two-component system, cell cycle sensor histidine kinase and response regulator CckA